MKKLILIVVLFISYTAINPQSILHPKQFGLGYHIGFASISRNTFISHILYVSTGKVDVMAGFSKPVNYSGTTVSTYGLSYTHIKENRKLYPTVSISLTNAHHKNFLGIGLSMAGDLVHFSAFKILPEAGFNFNYTDIGSVPGKTILRSTASCYVGTNFCVSYTSGMFTIAPGIHFASEGTEYFVTFGLSFMP